MIGDWIKQQRVARGWSQSKLAETSGISLGYLKQLEINERPNPGGEILSKLAGAFEVTVDEVLAGAQRTSEEQAVPPSRLLRGIWTDQYIRELEEDWPMLSQKERAYWWQQAHEHQARRAEIAEARQVLAQINEYHRKLDSIEARRRSTEGGSETLDQDRLTGT